MNLCKYVLKTNIKQKQADWAEYRALRNQYNDACHNVDCARRAISCVAGCDMRAAQVVAYPICMVYQDDEINAHNNWSVPNVVYCSHFDARDNKNGCWKLDCPCAQKNQKYHQLRQQAEQMKQRLDSFWKDKFAHVK